MLNPERYFAVRDDAGALIGFLYFEPKEDVLEYGLGLRPDLTGKGLGLDFFRAGLEFGRARYRPSLVRLFVAAFNERAITVYERAGFRETGRHVRTFERWGDVEFVEHGRAELIEVAREVREAAALSSRSRRRSSRTAFRPVKASRSALESERRVRDGGRGAGDDRRARRRRSASD